MQSLAGAFIYFIILTALQLQATKTQQTAERPLSDPGIGAASTVSLLREAAADAAVLGDGVGLSGRYRDGDFFIPDHQTGNRDFEEQELSVKGGTASLLDSAVLDLMADDQVPYRKMSVCP